ncbi:unnamed protein product [Closterium sp. Naga37s-1]|nr:unnamed protein product [Closterium sp. Naga37s-1]
MPFSNVMVPPFPSLSSSLFPLTSCPPPLFLILTASSYSALSPPGPRSTTVKSKNSLLHLPHFPLMHSIPPQATSATPLLPKVTPLLPKVTPLLPKVTPLLPKVTPLLPKVTLLLPKVTPLLPKVTPLLPKVTPLLPKVTPLLPKMAPLLAKVTPLLPKVPLPCFPRCHSLAARPLLVPLLALPRALLLVQLCAQLLKPVQLRLHQCLHCSYLHTCRNYCPRHRHYLCPYRNANALPPTPPLLPMLLPLPAPLHNRHCPATRATAAHGAPGSTQPLVQLRVLQPALSLPKLASPLQPP